MDLIAQASSAPAGLDPAFVQHSIGDLATRFSGYLIFILAFSTMVWGGVQGMFYFFKVEIAETKWDEWCILVVGLFFAVGLDWNMWFYVAGLTEPQFVKSLELRSEMGSPSAWIHPTIVLLACNLTTGALVVAGKRTIVSMAESFADGMRSIKQALPIRNGQGE